MISIDHMPSLKAIGQSWIGMDIKDSSFVLQGTKFSIKMTGQRTSCFHFVIKLSLAIITRSSIICIVFANASRSFLN